MLIISSSLQYNRMNRYIAIHYKGLGASKVNDEDIIKSDFFVLSKEHRYGKE